MNSVLNSIELHNTAYNDNEFPENIYFNTSKNTNRFIKDLDLILNCTEYIWEIHGFPLKYAVKKLRTNLFFVRVDNADQAIVMGISNKVINNIYLNYTVNNKNERIKLRDRLLMDKLSGISHKTSSNIIYNEKEFNNLKYFQVSVPNKQDTMIYFTIYFNQR